MSVFTGRSAGFSGNEDIGTPSGGGSFRYQEAPGPVPGSYAGSCPGDPGCPGRSVEQSPSTSWSDVGKQLIVTAATAYITKELGPKDSPGNRQVNVNDKGELGKKVEAFDDPFYGKTGLTRTVETPAGKQDVLAPAAVVLIAVGLIVVLLFSSRMRR